MESLKISKTTLKKIFCFFIAVVFFIENNPTVKLNLTLRYMFIIMAAGTAIIIAVVERDFKIDSFMKWTIGVLSFFTLSSIWAFYSQEVIQCIKNIIVIYVILLAIKFVIKTKDDFVMLLKSVVFAFIADTIYVLLTVGIQNLGTMRLGADYTGLEIWNANSIASFTSWGCILAVYLVQCSSGKFKKIWWSSIAALLTVVTMFTGSRKGFIITGFILLIYLLYVYRGIKRLRNFLLAAVIVLLSYEIIINVPAFYNLIGTRINRMIMVLLGNRAGEQSMSSRIGMIELGFLRFKERPILGYGLGQYHVLYAAATGWDTYSHNNFIEILVGGGVVGFIVYYSIYVKLIIQYILKIKKKRRNTTLYFFIMLLTATALNSALVCYSNLNYITVLLLAYIVNDKITAWEN